MSDPRTTLVLSRHGRTVWHSENRYAGTSDIDLDGVGQEQAARLADWVEEHRPAAVACSPVRRARETAMASAAVLGHPLLVVEDLREVAFGVAEGRTLSELASEDPAMAERFRADPATHHFPGAEPAEVAAARGDAALRALAADHPDRIVLVVAHNTLLRLAICRLLGVPVRSYREVFPRLDNGALSVLTLPSYGGGCGSLLSLNVPLIPLVPLVPLVPARPPTPDSRRTTSRAPGSTS